MNSNESKTDRSFFGQKLTLRQLLTKRALPVAALILLLPAIGLGIRTLASPASNDEAPQAAARPLAVEIVEAKGVTSHLVRRSYTGRIVARRSSDLSFQRTGELINVLVDQGDRVEKGQSLAVLDTRRLESRKKQLLAQRDQADAQLKEMIAGPRRETIEAARARLKSFEIVVEELKLQFGRRERLLENNAVSREDYENIMLRRQAADARLEEAKHQLDELLNGTRAEKITAQRAAVAQLDAQLAELEIEIDYSSIEAPFAGSIAARMADEGAVVAPGIPVLRLVEDGALEAWVGLPIKSALRMSPSEVYPLQVGGQVFDATFARRLPELDGATRTCTIVLTLPAEVGGLMVTRQIARLELDETVQEDGFWLPNTALIKGERGLWSVYVAQPTDEGYQAARRDVELLYADSDRALVRGTIQPGDEIVIGGVHRIVPGQRVQPIDR